MRSGWQAIGVVMFSLIALGGSKAPVRAQDMGPVVRIEAGGQNPTGIVDVIGSIQDLNALQIILTAETQPVSIDRIAVGFGRVDRDATLGNVNFLDTLRARLIDDSNANGTLDPGETVLGTQTLDELETPDSVTFTLSPALDLAIGEAITLLTVIDINSSESAQITLPSIRTVNWSLLVLPLLGLLLTGAGGRSWLSRLTRHYLPVLILILLWSAMLPGCDGDNEDDELNFVVTLPSNGVTSQTIRLGPANAIAGIIVRLTE